MTSAISSATDTTAATTATTSSAVATAKSSEDRFLKLLVAQLSNQDPMNPMDNAQMTSQMAQISTVSSVQQVNETLKSVSDQLAAMQMLQGSSLVGHDVLVPGSTLAPVDGKATGAVDLELKADSVTVDILSGSGQVLETINMGAQEAGRHTFTWDASKYPGVTAPTFAITATIGGKAVTAAPLAQDKVVSVSSDNGTMNVQLQKLGSVAYSNVSAIL